MTTPRPLSDPELALSVVYYIQCGPDENTGTPAVFLDRIGANNTLVNQKTLDAVTAARNQGVPVYQIIAFEKVAQDLFGWDRVRAHAAFAGAEARGWLSRAARAESN